MMIARVEASANFMEMLGKEISVELKAGSNLKSLLDALSELRLREKFKYAALAKWQSSRISDAPEEQEEDRFF
jgi:hypothetical protein